MRRLADGFEKRTRRVILTVAHYRYSDAQPRRDGALRNRVRRVVSPFGMDVRPQFFQESLYVRFGEGHDVVYAFERRNELRARVFIQEGAAGAFQVAHAGIRVHANDKNVPFKPGSLEITNMPDVQGVEAAVGKDDSRVTILDAATRMI
jgi:hypothetical protein